MGAYFYILVAAKKKDEKIWHRIDPFVKGKEPNSFTQVETYYNGSRSYFSRTWDKLEEIGISGYEKEKYEDGFFDGFGNLEELYYGFLTIDYQTFLNKVPAKNVFQKTGFVLKDDLEECDGELDTDCLTYISAKEHHKLSAEEQKCYTFVEFDDDYGWQTHFKDIKESVQQTISLNQTAYSDGAYAGYDWEYSLICIASW